MAQAVDEKKVEEFVFKALGDAAGMQAVLLCSIGDRLGLFKDLVDKGPGTSAEIAKRTGLNERY
ncbi:MAG: SAM-dependent methyltransferase, partial [Actinomycetota bacterium]